MISSKTSDPSLVNDKANANTQQQQLMDDLQHIIHYIALLLRILQWKESDKVHSLVFFCSLILCSTLYRFILYSAPVLFAILKIYNFYNEETRHHSSSTFSRYSLIDDLTEIHEKVQLMTAMKNWVQQESDTVCRIYYKKYLSISSAQQRSKIILSVSCLFILFYAGWLILLQQIYLTSLVWCALLAIMCLYCPWFDPIQAACVRAAIVLMHAFYPPIQIKAPLPKDKQVEKYITGYRFEMYHHQRWWFPTGWSNLLLSQDRPVWSDVHLETTPSIHDFRLPPPVTIGKPNGSNQQKIASWTWGDPCWSKHQDSYTDKNGWQYGNWQWKNWTCRSSGLSVYTRRRKWYRYAQRVESWVDITQTESHENTPSSSFSAEGSSTTSSPPSIFDGSISSSSNSTSSISYITANAPILISFDNKGERMLRRRSSNLSSKSVSFNITRKLCSKSPSADDMYNKYCKSPRPQKLKRFSI